MKMESQTSVEKLRTSDCKPMRLYSKESQNTDRWSYQRLVATASLVFPLLIFGATLITLGFIIANWLMLGIGFVTLLVSVLCAIVVRLCGRTRKQIPPPPPPPPQESSPKSRNLSIPSIYEEARLSLTSPRKTSSLLYLRPISSEDLRRMSTSSSVSRKHSFLVPSEQDQHASMGLFIRENRLSVSSHLSVASAAELRHWKPSSSEDLMIDTETTSPRRADSPSRTSWQVGSPPSTPRWVETPPSTPRRVDTPCIVINNNEPNKLDNNSVSLDELQLNLHETEL
ncbi:uncharacterized protein LOC144435905 [Glandiceps talaboti]